MHTAIFTLMIMVILPLVWAWVSGYYRNKELGGIDHKNPREQSSRLTGPGARAVAAQANAWEALIVYSASLLAVTASAVPSSHYATLSLVFLALRIAHGVFYIANLDILRSVAFAGGYGICIYMFVLAL